MKIRFFSQHFSTLKLPTLEIASLCKSSSIWKDSLSSKISESSQKHGFFLIKPLEFPFKTFFEESRTFFKTPDFEKRHLRLPDANGFLRGYIGIGEESGSDQFEVKEAFSYGYNWLGKPENELQRGNLFPERNKKFKQVMEKAYRSNCDTALTLTEIFALGLDQDRDYFKQFCRKGHTISLMRLFHYFPYEKAPDTAKEMRKIGSSEHTDWGFLTIIAEEPGKSGLQVFENDKWWDIEVPEGSLVVNCGDYLSLVSGGKFKSPLHRVVSKGQERISGVFFYYPDYDAKIPQKNDGEYSLFKEQKQGRNLKKEELEGKSFGEFITAKWKQVEREGKMY